MLDIFMSKAAIVAGAVGAISVLLSATGLIPNPTPVVKTTNGPIQGRISYSRSGNSYLEYLGIPYAEAPVGDLRFEPPVKLKSSWTDVKQATSYPPVCFQFDTMIKGRLEGVEDCLYLNVFTYDVNPEIKKPVIVYIHGGGFATGSSVLYGPASMMDEDIVLVTFNYRLGPLGFLNIGNNHIRGNMGLKDQNLVLRWIKENIHNFGGHPSKITLMGESAGSASVQYHIVSPQSEGLFTRGILQSGAVTCPWSFSKNPSEVAMKYINLLNCPTGNMTDLIKCLKTIDAAELVKLQVNLMDPLSDFAMFAPSAEPTDSKDAFLTENPRELLKTGRFAKIPVLFGVLSGEGALRTARFHAMPRRITEMDKNWSSIAPMILGFNEFHQKEEASKEIRDYYFGSHSFSENHEFMKNFSHLNSDGLFFEPIHRAAGFHAKHGSPTYLYYYDYDSVMLPSIYSAFRAVRSDDWMLSELKMAFAIIVDWFKENVFHTEGPHDFGSTHGDDLFQMWNMLGITNFFAGMDYEFSRSFIKAFVSFARNESPLEFNGVSWPPIQHSPSSEAAVGSATQRLKYMLLDKQGKMIDEPFANRMQFWESLRIRESD